MMTDGYAQLIGQLAQMTVAEQEAPFNGANLLNSCGARWVNDSCTRDMLAHLYEWQCLMRVFVEHIQSGQQQDYLPAEYRKNYKALEKILVEKHQRTLLNQSAKLLEESHNVMLALAEEFTDEELFTKGYYKCTYTTSLAAYFISVTVSPYAQAVKILKTHKRKLNK